MNNLKNANTVLLSDSLRLPRGPWDGPLTLPAFNVMVGAAELVVPLSMPLGILRHIKQFQVIVQQTEAGSPYTKELPVLNEICHTRYVKTTRQKLRRGTAIRAIHRLEGT